VLYYFLNPKLFFRSTPQQMVDRSTTAELANLKSVAAFWELLVRNGAFLPEYSSKYITEKQLLLIQKNEIFAIN
jgi:hypothetical protein